MTPPALPSFSVVVGTKREAARRTDLVEPMPTEPPSNSPSFSIVLETENLASAGLDKLSQCLASLTAQDLSPVQAKEVMLVNSGAVPDDLLVQLRATYPWILVFTAESSVDYYEAKMLGASCTTGEIVVFCDSDVTYEPNWLREMLTPFSQEPDIQVVSGETTTPVDGPYGLAMSLTYIFPRFSYKPGLHESSSYDANSVAFRRDFLQRHPIPSGLPIYRGNGVLHYRALIRQGHKIWKNPTARAVHPLPDGFSNFFWRFLLLGHEVFILSKLTSARREEWTPDLARFEWRDFVLGARIASGMMMRIGSRSYDVLAEDPRRLIYLPLAVPIVALATLLFFLGLSITCFSPNYVLKRYEGMEAP